MSKRPYAGGLPLSIVAGFSRAAIERLRPMMDLAYQEKTTGTNVLHPTRLFRYLEGNGKGEYQQAAIDKFLKELAAWVSGQRGSEEGKTNPCHISFLYIAPATHDEHRELLKNFVGFCRCVPLSSIHEDSIMPPSQASELIRRGIGMMGDLWHPDSRSSYFALPLRNFQFDSQRTAFDLALENVIADPGSFPLPESILNKDDCRDKSKCRECPICGKRKKAPIDFRKICFVKAKPEAEHGYGRYDGRNPQVYLEGLYRFGQPIAPGAQHDAQREKGRSLKDIGFKCILKGSVQKDVGHMNVYANDVVNAPKK